MQRPHFVPIAGLEAKTGWTKIRRALIRKCWRRLAAPMRLLPYASNMGWGKAQIGTELPKSSSRAERP